MNDYPHIACYNPMIGQMTNGVNRSEPPNAELPVVRMTTGNTAMSMRIIGKHLENGRDRIS